MNHKKAVCMCTVGASVIFLFLWQQVQATRLGYEMSRAHSELRHRRDQVAYLRLQLDRLHSPERIAEAARRRLGMSPMNPESVVFLGNAVARTQDAKSKKRTEAPRYLTRLLE
ncbi:hypothetical protein ACFL2T_05610 [Elusimicrobiota bacterium]